ncbi:OprD family outer membrane porin [Thorsellia anophelis]|uniref:Outer membrane porin, OprD family n=1 Tax=Thorsellia anophelis DSM 18579 TaxID=1123402 RepID=A0A1I0DZ39_9GAMM|nr:OprD family outer membrane porin [Thorsellia anophelis]SET37974.1 outer membrane porin, OprD family [Thorsellia anophelis DSM 18579]
MKFKNTRLNKLTCAVASAVVFSTIGLTLPASANPSPNIPTSSSLNPFFDESKLTGGLYFWSRERTRKNVAWGDTVYKPNLVHTASNLVLDYKSGYAADMFGIELAGVGALSISDTTPYTVNEIALSNCRSWSQKFDHGGDENCGGTNRSGAKIFRAAAKFKSDPIWINAGYIQPQGQTILTNNWSFTPGAYQGAEIGGNFDFGTAGALSTSYMWVNRYMAPWHTRMDKFYQKDGRNTRVSYAHSAGFKYDFKNDFSIESAFGQTEGFIDYYLGRANYKFDVMNRPLSASYGFYAANDKAEDNTINDVYDGTAWKQALMFGYKVDDVSIRLEGTWIHAEGRSGEFGGNLFKNYASGDGRGDIWWDNRSDFNANGQKAIFLGLNYALDDWDLKGWNVNTSGVYAWDAKPVTWRFDEALGQRVDDIDQNQRIKERAYSVGLNYTVQDGRAKGTYFSLYYTQFFNDNSKLGSYDASFPNIFQDEKDFKAMVIIPFTII